LERRGTRAVSAQCAPQELTKLMGKFKHLKEEEHQILQEQVDKRYHILKSLCESFETPK
jgi:hypothetical protein